MRIVKTDIELLNEFLQTDDTKVFGELYSRYLHLVFGVCMKYLKNKEDANDATMNIYEHTVERIGKYEVLDFKRWLYTVTKNYCLMLLRKKQSKVVEFNEEIVFNDVQVMENDLYLHHIDKSDTVDITQQLQDCLKALKQEQYDCVDLFYLKEKSYIEVSKILNVALNKVKSRIQNGKRNLKICLENNK